MNPQPRPTTDAVEMLEADHRTIKKLFQDYEDANADAREEIARRIFEEIEVHAKVESEVFYPVLETTAKAEVRRWVRKAIREHEQVNDLILELKDLPPRSERFQDLMSTLRTEVERHIEEEEDDMLPLAEQVLAGVVAPLGERMRDFRVILESVHVRTLEPLPTSL